MMNPIKPHRFACVFALLTLLTLLGCNGYERLQEHPYGTRGGGQSINGVSVLSQMFDAAGHRVRSWRALSPSLEKADVVIWFNQDFDAPNANAVMWFEDWLNYSPGQKTLVYVGRDYVAGPHYWRTMLPAAPKPQQGEYRKRMLDSNIDYASSRPGTPNTPTAEGWFDVDLSNPSRRVKELDGPWSVRVDDVKSHIEHRSYLKPAPHFDALLSDAAGHPLVSEFDYGSGNRVILIENGSFLLNGALVNHEHRKLAGKLIAEVGAPQQDVVFLETGHSPLIVEDDPTEGPPTGLALLSVWPIGAVLSQMAALGIVAALALWPIFGIPRRAERDSLTDFGRHVSALGRLLAATRNPSYAYAQLQAYFRPKE